MTDENTTIADVRRAVVKAECEIRSSLRVLEHLGVQPLAVELRLVEAAGGGSFVVDCTVSYRLPRGDP